MDEKSLLPRRRQEHGSSLGLRHAGGRRAIEMSGIRALLSSANLRPTRQRLVLGALLFSGEYRHVTADGLHAEACERGAALSLATVYNTLDQFVSVGLVRRIAGLGARSYFDTDIRDHQHFYIEAEERIIDIPDGAIRACGAPEPPDGYEIAKIDVVIRLRRIGNAAFLGSDGATTRNVPTSAPGDRFLGAAR